MYSLIAGAVLFFCCAYAGFGISDYYKRRYLLFHGLCGYVEALESGVSYVQLTVPEITESYGEGKKGDFARMLARFSASMKDGSEMSCKTLLLTAYEHNLLAKFFDSLGKYDYDSQLAELKRYGAIFGPLLESSRKQYESVGKLAAKMGVLTGIAVMLALA